MAALLGMSLFAIATQGLSSIVTIKKDINDAYEHADVICKQIASTNDKISKVNTLRATIEQAQSISTQSAQDILELQNTTQREIQSIQAMKVTFHRQFFIAIIMNIVLVTILSLQLFL